MPEDHMDELYNSGNFLVRFVHNNRLDNIVKLFPQGKKLKVLDAGCGEGHLIKKMHDKHPDYSYYGVDITDVALKKAKKRCPYARIEKMDLEKLRFSGDSFDIIVNTEVIEHVYN